jgi:hypothetical protein
MRKQILEDGLTLTQVGELEGVTGERIRQLVGPIRSKHSRMLKRQERVVALAKSGQTDRQIAATMGLGLNGSIRHLRRQAGVRPNKPPRKHTQESAIWCARKWFELFHYTPAATDWNPPAAIAMGHTERAERFHEFRREFGAPYPTQVQLLFGSWSEFIRQTGLEPAPRGYRARGHWKIDQPSD